MPISIAVALVAFAPMLGAVLTPMLHRAFGAKTSMVVSLVPAASFVFLLSFLPVVAEGAAVRATLPWVPSLGLDLAFLIDGLSLTFALTIAGIGTFILVYSGSYLRGHPHQARFLGFMLLFMGAMQGLVLADSTVALYGFWELTSVTSFLLIGFDHARERARRAAIQALVVTGIGGLALLAAGVLLFVQGGSWDLSQLRAASALEPTAIVAGLVILAAFTKSAQVPFHFWLPNAMEAPTPVSAFLHSATMVQGGVYLLARFTPLLSEVPSWTPMLVIVGGATLLWGGIGALRQTDLKQMLAQTTIASLGLLVLLIGLGTEEALVAALVYFVAHALYKAGLFLVAGAIDHGTGTRDITGLGGLRRAMPWTFSAALLGALAMFGLPPLLAFVGKEHMYEAALHAPMFGVWSLAGLVIGNALMGAIGIALVVRPFLGRLGPFSHPPHEAGLGMLAGPLLFGVLGVVAGFAVTALGDWLLLPAAAAALGEPVVLHLHLVVDIGSPVFWLSLLTWGLGGLLYWSFDAARDGLARVGAVLPLSLDRGFDHAMFSLIRFAGWVTRTVQHGRLELYLVVVFLLFAAALILPVTLAGGLPSLPPFPAMPFYEWVVMAIAVVGVVTVVLAPTRLFGILALGVQGLAVALLYLLFGAPDLSFTQFMVEVLSVVIIALVMTRLNLQARDPRPLEDWLRDGTIALCCGLGTSLLLFAVLQQPFDPRLSTFFNHNSVEQAHGHNIVNVILVDFRGLDTLGEISVVATAGLAITALIGSRLRWRRERAKAGGGAA